MLAKSPLLCFTPIFCLKNLTMNSFLNTFIKHSSLNTPIKNLILFTL